MPFDSKTGAQAGRKSNRKGVSNERSRLIKEKLDSLIENNLEQIEEDLKSLEPKDRLNILVKYMEFAHPKLSRSQVEQEAQEFIINFNKTWGK